MGSIQQILNSFGNETVQIIKGNLASTGTDATRETSNSLLSNSTQDSVKVTGKPFIFVVETGRRPGKRPPIGPIEKWLSSGKVNVEGNIRSAAFAISKVIGREGTKLFQRGGREDIITPAISDSRVDKLSSDIADEVFNKTIKVIDDAITSSDKLAF